MKTIILAAGTLLAVAALAAPPRVTPELIKKGGEVFTTNCVVCHGETGDGNGPAGAAMNPRPRDLGGSEYKNGNTPEAIFKTLEKGLEGTTMVAFAHLPEEDRWALAHYVTTTFVKKPAKADKPAKGKK